MRFKDLKSVCCKTRVEPNQQDYNNLHTLLFHIHILYISKSWNVVFNVTALLLSHINITSLTYFQCFLSLSFLIIFLIINLPLYNYTFSNIYLLLYFYLPITLYLNLIISPSLHLPFILTLLLLIFLL